MPIEPPPRRDAPPPMALRSFISVVIATLPPIAFPAHQPVGGNAHVGEEHLVELGLAGDLVERLHLDAGALHVEQEVRHAVVLRHVGIRACEQHAPFREMCEARPDFLSVEDPRVAVAHRAGRQAGHVRAGARLAEQLAPDVLAGEDPAQQVLAHPVGAVGEHGRRAHADADRVDHHVVVGGARVPAELVGDDGLQLRRDAEAAEPFGEMHPRQAVVVLLAAEGELVRPIGMRGLDQRTDPAADLFFAHFTVCHGRGLPLPEAALKGTR